MGKINNNFPHEYAELITLLNLAKLTIQDRERITDLVLKIKKWDLFFELVESNAVELMVCKRLEKILNTIKNDLVQSRLANLQKKVIAIKKRTTTQLNLLHEIILKMSQEGVDVIILKGALFAHTLYDFPIYKKMNDIDILVKNEQAQKASLVLNSLGFECVSETLFSQNQFSQSTHHSPPYIHRKHKCITGIHWGIHSPQRQFSSDIKGIWMRKIPISFNNTRAYQMCWEDNLLHLCIHLPFYKTGLREIADVYNVILFSSPSISWDVFLQRCYEWNSCEPVYRVLSLTYTFLRCLYEEKIYAGNQLKLSNNINLDEINSVIQDCKKHSSQVYIQDTELRKASIETLLLSRSTHLSRIEKSFLVFRMSENYFEKLNAIFQTWWLTFFPNDTEMQKISCFGSRFSHLKKHRVSWVKTRITTPFKIIRALNYEHGSKTIFFLTLQNILILLRDSFSFEFLKRRPSILNSKYKSILKDLE